MNFDVFKIATKINENHRVLPSFAELSSTKRKYQFCFFFAQVKIKIQFLYERKIHFEKKIEHLAFTLINLKLKNEKKRRNISYIRPSNQRAFAKSLFLSCLTIFFYLNKQSVNVKRFNNGSLFLYACTRLTYEIHAWKNDGLLFNCLESK